MSEKRYDVVGIGSMVVDTIHLTPRVAGPDEKALLRAAGDGVIARRLV